MTTHHAGLVGPIEVRVSVPNAESAQRISNDLMARDLATGVHVLGPMASIYSWEGEVHQTEEWLLLVQTSAEAFAAVSAAICALHRYESPEVTAVPVTRPDGGPQTSE